MLHHCGEQWALSGARSATVRPPPTPGAVFPFPRPPQTQPRSAPGAAVTRTGSWRSGNGRPWHAATPPPKQKDFESRSGISAFGTTVCLYSPSCRATRAERTPRPATIMSMPTRERVAACAVVKRYPCPRHGKEKWPLQWLRGGPHRAALCGRRGPLAQHAMANSCGGEGKGREEMALCRRLKRR